MTGRDGKMDLLRARLGFGCAYLVGGWESAQSLRQIDVARAAGFTHFDVAPAYGMGSAESILGRALIGKRADFTIASKVGIGRPRFGTLLLSARAMLRPMKKIMPGLSRRAGGAVYKSSIAKGCFSDEQLEASLSATLRNLRTDYLDLLLLHEATIEDLSDEVLTFLDRVRRRGNVRSIGVASSVCDVLSIRSKFGNVFDVWQHSWNALSGVADMPPITITHRAIHGAFGQLSAKLVADADFASKISTCVGLDLKDPQILSQVLIGASVAHNLGGLTLVSSRNLGRISQNAECIKDDRYVHAGRRLVDALASS